MIHQQNSKENVILDSSNNNNSINSNNQVNIIENEIRNNNNLIEELKSSNGSNSSKEDEELIISQPFTSLSAPASTFSTPPQLIKNFSNPIINNTNNNKEIGILKKILSFICKPKFNIIFGLTFSPLYLLESIVIVMIIQFLNQFSNDRVPLYIISIIVLYLSLWLGNLLKITDRVTRFSNNNSSTTNNNNNNESMNGEDSKLNNKKNRNSISILLEEENHTLQSPSFRNKINHDVKSMINFYETKNKELTTHLKNLNLSDNISTNNNNTTTTTNKDYPFLSHNNHTIHQSFTSFSDLDQSTTYRNRFRNNVNRKTLPPDYYNQYLKYLIHTNLEIKDIVNQHTNNNNTIDDISEFSEISDDNDSLHSFSSQNSNGMTNVQHIQSSDNNNNKDETKEELSILENSKRVKSTINHFTKLSTGVEEKLEWTLTTCTLQPPRSNHTVTVYGQSLVLIGGDGISEKSHPFIQFIDVERNITITPKVTGSKSAPESIHSHDYCRIGNKLYIFGGVVSNKPSNKLFVLTVIDDSTVHWSTPRINGYSPNPRYGHTFTRYGNKFILFGGYDDNKTYNDLHLLDSETMSWSTIDINGIAPCERFGHTTTILGEKLIIFGGSTIVSFNNTIDGSTQKTHKELNDVNILQLDTVSWIQPQTHSNLEMPPERSHHSATRVGRNLIIVGGKREGVTLRDIWILSYKMQWSKVTGTQQITPHSHHTIIKNGSKLLILGGKGSNGATLDDIWIVNTGTLPISSSVSMINYPDIKIEKEIGKGHFSKVWRGNWKGLPVAVKKINIIKEKGKEELMNEFKTEVELLGTLQHPNLVTCYGYSLNPMCIVMEFLPTGNLFELIHNRAEHKLDSTLMLQFAFDIARGMQHLHSRNIIHRDLKSSNLLLDKHFNVKIADLGIARETSFTQTMTTIGTVAWTAPEILRHESYNQKADVYSYAIVIWELLTGEEPYAGIPAMNAGILVASKELRPDIPENCDPNWKKLVSMCWSEDPNKRPSFEEITNYLTKTF